jgi:hypothetical protein
MVIPSSASHIGSRRGVSTQLRRISVLGPTFHWTQDVSVFLPILYPFLAGIPHALFLSQRERDAQGDLPPQSMCPNLVWSDIAEGFPNACTVFNQRMGRKQQRYAKLHRFLEDQTSPQQSWRSISNALRVRVTRDMDWVS